MNLLEELIDTFLLNSDEMSSVLNVKTGEVLLEAPGSLTGEPEIDWDDDEVENLIPIPQISSSEAYRVMVEFTKAQSTDIAVHLVDVLNSQKPFRRFKDKVMKLGIEEKWYRFEHDYAKERVMKWLEELHISF